MEVEALLYLQQKGEEIAGVRYRPAVLNHIITRLRERGE